MKIETPETHLYDLTALHTNCGRSLHSETIAFVRYLFDHCGHNPAAMVSIDGNPLKGPLRIAVGGLVRADDVRAFFAAHGHECFAIQAVPARPAVPVPSRGNHRPSWDRYFMDMAHLVATRATCDRKHVGAVVVRDKRVVATGYNGSAPGLPHCDEVGHDLVRQADGTENCVRTVHAEANAILQAAQYGVPLAGTTLYTNTYPCWHCAKAILGARIVTVVVDQDYKNDPRVADAFKASGVRLVTLAGVGRHD